MSNDLFKQMSRIAYAGYVPKAELDRILGDEIKTTDMNLKHTPGPWKLQKALHGYAIIANTERKLFGQDCVIGSLELKDSYSHDGRFENEEEGTGWFNADALNAEANANLIAAAPELLAALQDLVFTAQKLWDDSKPIKDSGAMIVTHPIIEQSKAAIAKATNQIA